MILEIFFRLLSNTNIKFVKKYFLYRTYSISKTILTTKRALVINHKKFFITALDSSKKVFNISIAYLWAKMFIYLAKKVQIILLFAKKVIVSEVYLNFTNVFSKKSATELF